MKKVFIFISVLLSISLYAQKQTSFWYFGERAGLDFNSGNPVALIDGQLATTEGCAAISDFNGNLLFYTDGITVWHKNHAIMQNGEGLHGDHSSTNSAIIIPKPEDTNTYFIFTVDDSGGVHGLQYSVVDITADGGLGAVVSKNIPLRNPVTEKITAVKHQNDIDWWILIHDWESTLFVAYLITNSGISLPITTNIGTLITGSTSNTIGAMKFSPDGKKIGIANSYDINQVQLLDFNDVNGAVSNPITLSNFNGIRGAYGVAFSVNSKLLYITDSEGTIYQYNIESNNSTTIINSRIEIATNINGLGALQIAPNGKIYVAKENSHFLGVITSPNTVGLGANYINDGIYLEGRNSKFGLPPFIQSYFWKQIETSNLCFGELTEFILVDPEISQTWDFGDPLSGINNTSTDVNPTHTFSASGTYSVQVETINTFGETTTTTIHVIISDTPIASTPTDYEICDDNLDDNDSNGFVQNFLLSSKDAEILGAFDPNQYNVSYYQDNNFSTLMPKEVDYQNTIAYEQAIYAKVYNKDNDLCFDTVTFNLKVFQLPKFDVIDEFIICQNTLNNNITIENPLENYNYIWYNSLNQEIGTGETLNLHGSNTLDITTFEGAFYTVVAANQTTLCKKEKTILIKKSSIATITETDIISIDYVYPNNFIEINIENIGFGDYEFSLEHSFDTKNWQDQPIFTNLVGGNYIIFIRDKNGCGTIAYKVTLLNYPKFFTPNNDGENDYWQIKGFDISRHPFSTIFIFDRYGKVITKINTDTKGWDGTYNGKKLPEDDYWFTVTITDITTGDIIKHKGHFSLIRR